MDFISILSIFVLACFVGYYVVWSVTPALHTPLMAVTNAISSVIIVGALIAAATVGGGIDPVESDCVPINNPSSERSFTPNPENETGTLFDAIETMPDRVTCAAVDPRETPQKFPWGKWLGLLGIVLASVNIFGGFAVTERMLAMYKKKEKK